MLTAKQERGSVFILRKRNPPLSQSCFNENGPWHGKRGLVRAVLNKRAKSLSYKNSALKLWRHVQDGRNGRILLLRQEVSNLDGVFSSFSRYFTLKTCKARFCTCLK